MDFHDSETQRLLRTTARSYLASAFPAERLYGLHSGAERLTSVDIGSIAELGWLGLVASESAGGDGASLLDAAVVVEEAGFACAPIPVVVANVAAMMLSASLCSDMIPALARGESLVTIAESSRVRATSNGSSNAPTVVDGIATAILQAVPFADLSEFVITPAFLDGKPALVALPLRDATVAPIVQLDRACYADVTFNGAPAVEVIVLAEGPEAAAVRERRDALVTAFTVIEMAGLMQRVLEMTAEHISTRQQFGQPIGKFQAARHRAAELLTQVETTRWAAYHALWRFGEDGDASEIWLAKHWAARAADRVFQIAHLLHGGVGVGVEHPLHLYTQSIAAFAVRAGTMDEMVDRTTDLLGINA